MILLISFAFIALFVRLTLATIKSKKSNLSVLLRILTNHFQLLVLTLEFDLAWPSSVQRLHSAAEPVANVASRIISFDCFVSSSKPLLSRYIDS